MSEGFSMLAPFHSSGFHLSIISGQVEIGHQGPEQEYVGNASALHAAYLGSTPSIPDGLPSSPTVIPERHQVWPRTRIISKQNNKRDRLRHCITLKRQ